MIHDDFSESRQDLAGRQKYAFALHSLGICFIGIVIVDAFDVLHDVPKVQ